MALKGNVEHEFYKTAGFYSPMPSETLIRCLVLNVTLVIGSVTSALNVLLGTDVLTAGEQYDNAKRDGYNQRSGPALRRTEYFELNASPRVEWMKLFRQGVWMDAHFADILMPLLLRAQRAKVWSHLSLDLKHAPDQFSHIVTVPCR